MLFQKLRPFIEINQKSIQRSLLFLHIITYICIVQINSYPSCQTFTLNGYQFDLSPLKNQQYYIAQTSTGLGVQIQFCSPTLICNSTPTFVKYPSNTNCQVYALNQNPLKQNYKLISSNDPNDGLIINYLPYVKQSIQNNSTITRQYNFVLNIQCNTQGSTSLNKCTNTVTNMSSTYFINKLNCNYQSSTGCPILQKGYFWQFLIDNAIVFAIFLWAVSLFQLFFGYMAIRLTIFLYGVLTGSVFGIIYTAQNYVDFIYQDVGYGINIFIVCLSVLMGFLFGVALLTMPKLGYVNIGLWVAVIFSLLIQNSVLYLTGNLIAFYITVGVMGLIMTIISLLALRNFIILSTSFISGFWIIRPLGFFLPYYPNQFFSGKSYLLTNSTPWQFYLYLLSIIIIAILGSVFQFCCFKKSRGKEANEHFYLQNDGSIKQKLKNLFQFQQIKDLVKSGKQQILFLKKLVVDSDSEPDEQIQKKKRKGSYEQMKNQKQIQLSVMDSSQEESKQKNKFKNNKQQKQITNSSSGKSKAKILKLQEQPKSKKMNDKQISKGKKVVQKKLTLSSDSQEQEKQKKKNNKNNKSSSPEDQDDEENIKPNKLIAPIRQKPGKK